VADEARHKIGIRERLVLQDSLSADR